MRGNRSAVLSFTAEAQASHEGRSRCSKKVLESQKSYASLVVPAKRFLFPPYSFAANYYWPEDKPAAKAAKKQ